jgi:Stress responsive A/B Barrel Domain
VIHHIVLLRWTADTEPELIERFTAALRALPAVIPEIKTYACGSGIHDGNWDFGITASFDDVAGWQTYDDHPVHNEARKLVATSIADRAAAQIST